MEQILFLTSYSVLVVSIFLRSGPSAIDADDNRGASSLELGFHWPSPSHLPPLITRRSRGLSPLKTTNSPDLRRSTLVLLILKVIALVSWLLDYYAPASHLLYRALSLFFSSPYC